jgi:hypothetical protein
MLVLGMLFESGGLLVVLLGLRGRPLGRRPNSLSLFGCALLGGLSFGSGVGLIPVLGRLERSLGS